MFYAHKKFFIRTLLRCLFGVAVACTLLYVTVPVLTNEANAKVCFLPGGKCPDNTKPGGIRAIQGEQCIGYNLTHKKCEGQPCSVGWDCDSCTNAQGTYYRCREVDTPKGYEKGLKECKTPCYKYTSSGFTGNRINGKCTQIEGYVPDNPGPCHTYSKPDYVYGVDITADEVVEKTRNNCYYNIQSFDKYYTDKKNDHSPEIFDLDEKKGSDGITCYKAKACNAANGWSATSPDVTIFKVEDKTKDGITCYKATGCQTGLNFFDKETLGKYSGIYVNTDSYTSNNLTCYKATGCYKNAYSSEPDKKFFKSKKLNEEYSNGHSCWIITGKADYAYTANDMKDNFFDYNDSGNQSQYDENSKEFKTVKYYVAHKCDQYAYASQPNDKYFTPDSAEQYQDGSSTSLKCYIITGKGSYAYTNEEKIGTHFAYDTGAEGYLNGTSSKVKYYNVTGCAQYAYDAEPVKTCYSSNKKTQKKGGDNTDIDCWTVTDRGVYAYKDDETQTKYFSYEACEAKYLNGTSSQGTFYTMSKCGQYAYDAVPDAKYFASNSKSNYLNGKSNQKTCWNITGKGSYAYTETEKKTKYFAYESEATGHLNGNKEEVTYYNITGCAANAYSEETDKTYFAYNNEKGKKNGVNTDITCYNATGCTGEAKLETQKDDTHFAYSEKKRHFNGADAETSCYLASGCSAASALTGTQNTTMYVYDTGATSNGYTCYKVNSCNKGYKQAVADNAYGLTCTACGKGEYNATAGATTCEKCGAGTASNVEGATSAETCIPCAAGTYAAQGAATCTPCAAGYMSGAGAASCIICPKGTWSGAGASECTKCVAGTASDTQGATSAATCKQCAAGTYSVAGASECSKCAAGQTSVAGATACEDCAAGWYSDKAGSASCEKCDAGYYNNTKGSTSCTACHSGQYNTGKGNTSCTECPAGYYNTGTGNTSCTACGKGTYASGTGNTECTDCIAGKYASSEGSASCGLCGPGTWSGAKAESCTMCGKGTYSTTIGAQSEATCIKCPAGTYSNGLGRGSASACTPCAENTYSATDGSASCTDCGADEWSAAGATTCIKCATTYSTGDLWYVEGTTPSGCYVRAGGTDSVSCGGKNYYRYKKVDDNCKSPTEREHCKNYINTVKGADGVTYYYNSSDMAGDATTTKPSVTNDDCHSFSYGAPSVNGDGYKCYYNIATPTKPAEYDKCGTCGRKERTPTCKSDGTGWNPGTYGNCTEFEKPATIAHCGTCGKKTREVICKNNGTGWDEKAWDTTCSEFEKPADSETEDCTLTQNCTDSSGCTDTSTSCTDSSACTETSQYCNCNGTQTRTGTRTGTKQRTGFKNGTQSRTGSHTRTREVTCNYDGTGYTIGSWKGYGDCKAPTSTTWGACNVSGECIYTDWGSCGNYGDCEYTSWGDCSSTGCNIANNDYCEEHVCRPGNCRTVSATATVTVAKDDAGDCTNGYTNTGLCGEDDTCFICDDGTENRTWDGVKCNTCDSSFNLTVEPDANTSNYSHCYDGSPHYKLTSCKPDYKMVGNECVLKGCTDYNSSYVTSCSPATCPIDGKGSYTTCTLENPRTGLNCYIKTTTTCNCSNGGTTSSTRVSSDKASLCTNGYGNNNLCGFDNDCFVCNNGIEAANANKDALNHRYTTWDDGVTCIACGSTYSFDSCPTHGNCTECYDSSFHYSFDSCKNGFSKSGNTCVADDCGGYNLPACPTNGICEPCQKGKDEVYKLIDCDGEYKPNDAGTACVLKGCSDYNQSYVTNCTASSCTGSAATYTVCEQKTPRSGLTCYTKSTPACNCTQITADTTAISYSNKGNCTNGYYDDGDCGKDDTCSSCDDGTKETTWNGVFCKPCGSEYNLTVAPDSNTSNYDSCYDGSWHYKLNSCKPCYHVNGSGVCVANTCSDGGFVESGSCTASACGQYNTSTYTTCEDKTYCGLSCKKKTTSNCSCTAQTAQTSVPYSNLSKCSAGFTDTPGFGCGEDDTCQVCADGNKWRTFDGVKCKDCNTTTYPIPDKCPEHGICKECDDGTSATTLHFQLTGCEEHYKPNDDNTACVLKECTDYNKDYVTNCVSHPCGGDYVTCDEYTPRTGLKCYIRTSTICSCVQGTGGAYWVVASDKDKCTKGYTNNGICGQDDACIVCNNGISAANSNVDADGQYYISKLDGVNCNPCDSSFDLTTKPTASYVEYDSCYDGSWHYKITGCTGDYKLDSSGTACVLKECKDYNSQYVDSCTNTICSENGAKFTTCEEYKPRPDLTCYIKTDTTCSCSWVRSPSGVLYDVNSSCTNGYEDPDVCGVDNDCLVCNNGNTSVNEFEDNNGTGFIDSEDYVVCNDCGPEYSVPYKCPEHCICDEPCRDGAYGTTKHYMITGAESGYTKCSDNTCKSNTGGGGKPKDKETESCGCGGTRYRTRTVIWNACSQSYTKGSWSSWSTCTEECDSGSGSGSGEIGDCKGWCHITYYPGYDYASAECETQGCGGKTRSVYRMGSGFCYRSQTYYGAPPYVIGFRDCNITFSEDEIGTKNYTCALPEFQTYDCEGEFETTVSWGGMPKPY